MGTHKNNLNIGMGYLNDWLATFPLLNNYYAAANKILTQILLNK